MSEDDTIQVVMGGGFRDGFELWLAAHHLQIFPMPVFDPEDLPTYGIGPTDDHPMMKKRRNV